MKRLFKFISILKIKIIGIATIKLWENMITFLKIFISENLRGDVLIFNKIGDKKIVVDSSTVVSI